jgi:hypothetical protein
MTSAKLKKKYEQLPEVNRNILAEDLFLLPVEVKNFIAQTRNRFNPVTVAKAIQNKCREIFQYDFDYAQYSAQLPVNVEARMRFLHGKATVPGKEYAGVCADAAILLCQMLREAGILCGPVNGLLAKNKTITTKEAHAAVWALLPNEKGNLEIFILDGTPSESGVETVDTLDARENGAGELTADRGEMKKCLAMAQGELQDYLEGKLKIYNGRVEELLNMEFLGNPEKENGLVNLYLYLEMLRFSGFVEQGKIKALEEGWKDLDSGFGGVKFDPETIEQAKSGQAIIESFKKTAELLAREWGMTTIEARQTIRELATKITAPEMGIEEKAVVGLLGQYL